MPITNNVTRLLESKKIQFEIFELPPEKIGALETAELLGIPPKIVFKTIVITREKKKPILCIIPGPVEVDLKAVAAICGEKKVHVPTQKEAEELTGLQAGGISPLALINKGFTIFLDESAMQFTAIHISGGQRGLNIKVPVAALISLTGARKAKICMVPSAI
ncbi:MAG: aminoacyl-tRNA deacylase [Anaerolineaceae bacterium]